MGGVLVPANTPIYGIVRIEGQRMAVTVNSIESSGNILPAAGATVIVLVILVQIIQSVGTALCVKTDRRIQHTSNQKRRQKK